MVSNGFGSEGVPSLVSPIPSLSATGLGSCMMTPFVRLVGAAGAVRVTCGGGGVLVWPVVIAAGADVFSGGEPLSIANGIAVVINKMAVRIIAAAIPLLTRVLFANAPSISEGDLPRISAINCTSSSATAALLRLMPLMSRERLPIGETATSCAWPVVREGSSRLAKRMPSIEPAVDFVPSPRRTG